MPDKGAGPASQPRKIVPPKGRLKSRRAQPIARDFAAGEDVNMVGGDVLRHRDERRAHPHHSGIAREHRTHCAVVIEPIALNVATRVDAVDIGEHAMNADEAFRRNDALPCADQSVDAGREAARADEGVEAARALGIGAGDDDRRADSAKGPAKLHRGRNLAARRIEKNDGVEISLPDIFPHEFKKLGSGFDRRSRLRPRSQRGSAGRIAQDYRPI